MTHHHNSEAPSVGTPPSPLSGVSSAGGASGPKPWRFHCQAGGCDDGRGHPCPGEYWDSAGHPVCVACCGMPERDGTPAAMWVEMDETAQRELVAQMEAAE